MARRIRNALIEALEEKAMMEMILMFQNLNIYGYDDRDTPNSSMEHMHMSRDPPDFENEQPDLAG